MCAYCGGACSTRTYVESGKYRVIFRLCGVMRWAAGLLYASRGDEQPDGAPREPHIAPEHTPPSNRPLIRRRPPWPARERDGASAERCMRM
jgi:hypothetical protein